ncbi:MAG: 16S rRNA (guanine(527)-N(7))-methyltransferase RsmG [Anaerolineae bacterium]
MRELKREAAEFGLALSERQLEQFTVYQTLLLEWNRRMNLTTIREPAAVRQRHFLDSLTCATVMNDLRENEGTGVSLVDVGTGAGFPGVPLKILFPRLSLTLVESAGRKARFLEAVVQSLDLADVNIVGERAEVIGRMPEHRERYDWAVARGVSELRVLAEYLLPLCRVGGSMLAQKGEGGVAELTKAREAIETLGGGAAVIHSVRLPERAATHLLLVIEKVNPTPSRFPRRPGIPAKRPL